MGTGARTEDKPNVPRWLSPFSHHSLWTPGYAAEVRRADVRVREVFMSSSEGAAEQIKPVVIGAGPAGLTAAYEFGKRGVTSTVLEATDTVGGISQTAERDGWRFDIGGHRFFTYAIQRIGVDARMTSRRQCFPCLRASTTKKVI